MKTGKKFLQGLMDRMRSIQDDPRKVALGYAFGIFLATTPLVGLKVIVALPLLYLLGWNKTACLIGIFHVNGLNGAAFYGLVYFIGKSALGIDYEVAMPDHISFRVFLDFFIGSRQVFLSLLAGGLLLGVPMAFLAYKLLYHALQYRGKQQTADIHELQC